MFQKAIKKSIKLKLGIMGVSGSGKTFSALKIAKGLGGKTAVIDTENGSASLYSDIFDFDVVDLKPPFTVEKYIEAINAAEGMGYSNLIIDSITHAWAGEGGLLEQKSTLDTKPGSNSYTNWAPITKKDNAFKNAFLHSSCNIIATMRSKQEIVLQTDNNGKSKPVKMGMAAVQRDGLEYEFTIMFDINQNHDAEATKDRTGLFKDQIFKISEKTGEFIKEWLEKGAHEETNANKIKSILSPDIQKLVNKPVNHGSHVLTIGANKGKMLKDINSFDLHNFVERMISEKRVNPANEEEVFLVKDYLMALETIDAPKPSNYKDDID